jgi:hypothetical protein
VSEDASRRAADLSRLHFINTWFSSLTGSDLYLAEQIRSAIAFSLSELEAQTQADPASAERYDQAFIQEATRLLRALAERDPQRGFYHWDAARSLESATPLFAREEIMKALKQLARFRESTLLITNLRPAFLRSNKPGARTRLSEKREREYEQLLDFLRELIAARVSPHADIQVLFL